jgi:glycerol-3-phosphate dehydrogenase
LEAELLHGQKLAGIVAAEEVYRLLQTKKALVEFPFFTTIYLICLRKVPVEQLFKTGGEHLNIQA